MSTQFGKRISSGVAQQYFDAQKKVQAGIALTHAAVSAPNPNPNPANQEQIEMANVYSTSDHNAFVFDKQIIETLLNTESKNGKTADYLMIHFAAKFEDGTAADGRPYKKGEPTLVILGCNKSSQMEIEQYNKENSTTIPSDEEVFTSMDFDDPAAENPGGSDLDRFPNPGLLNSVVINFILK